MLTRPLSEPTRPLSEPARPLAVVWGQRPEAVWVPQMVEVAAAVAEVAVAALLGPHRA